MAGMRDRARKLAARHVDRRRLLVLVVLLGWAAIVGSGAGSAPDEAGWLGVPSLDELILAVVALMAVFTVLLLVAMAFSVRRGDTELPERKSRWPTVVLLVLLFAVALRFQRPDNDDRSAEPPEPEAPAEAAPTARSVVLGRRELVGLLIVGGVAIGAIIWTRRRLSLREAETDAAPPLERDLAPIIERAAVTLDLGDDPRSAVLGAYASFERALAELGHPRAASETAIEHTSRVLAGLDIDAAPVRHLAALYELARFSEHAITLSDQRTAAASLHRVRQELAELSGLSDQEEGADSVTRQTHTGIGE